MRIAVTGGSGKLGRHVVRRLIEDLFTDLVTARDAQVREVRCEVRADETHELEFRGLPPTIEPEHFTTLQHSLSSLAVACAVSDRFEASYRIGDTPPGESTDG